MISLSQFSFFRFFVFFYCVWILYNGNELLLCVTSFVSTNVSSLYISLMLRIILTQRQRGKQQNVVSQTATNLDTSIFSQRIIILSFVISGQTFSNSEKIPEEFRDALTHTHAHTCVVVKSLRALFVKKMTLAFTKNECVFQFQVFSYLQFLLCTYLYDI